MLWFWFSIHPESLEKSKNLKVVRESQGEWEVREMRCVNGCELDAAQCQYMYRDLLKHLAIIPMMDV